MNKIRKGWGLAVGVAGVLAGLPYLNLLPPKWASAVLAVSAGILAANGQLVPNGHREE